MLIISLLPDLLVYSSRFMKSGETWEAFDLKVEMKSFTEDRQDALV